MKQFLRILRTLLLVGTCNSVFLILQPAYAADSIVAVTDGRVRGTYASPGENVRIFRGIPYAAPPVGELRWRPPQPVVPWNGIKDCIEFGPSCLQPKQELVPQADGKRSEDCLYLNVWTAADSGAARPVMVWIHGGGFSIGSGSQRIYDGLHFARGGVVLVTLNYRLGPFGFFAHPALTAESDSHSSGNYGLLDQIAALTWVRRNIAVFGGDPNNVTVFGESAGSVSVGCLLASPLARGLFQRAIMESGVPVNLPKLVERDGSTASAEATGVEIARQLGISTPGANTSDIAAQLRTIPADQLLAATHQRVGLFGKGRKLGPVVDGYALPRSPDELFSSGDYNRVPVLLGTNADEGTLFATQVPVKRPIGYQILIRRLFGDFADQVLRMFPAGSREEVRAGIARLTTVAAFVAPTRRTARMLCAHQAAVWLYHFTHVPQLLERRNMGATHAAELFFVFRNMPAQMNPGPADAKVGQTMQNAWLRFAATGDPNGGDLPAWPAFSVENDTHLEFGDRPQIGKGLMRDACDLFDEIRRSRVGHIDDLLPH